MLFTTLLLVLTTSHARADEWIARLSCDNGGFVVDALHSFDEGFKDHQLVIRDPKIAQYFQSLVPIAFQPNAKGEIIRQGLGRKFDGSFEALLAHADRQVYKLWGHWLADGSYETYITHFYCGSGNCEPEANYLGKWIFHDCH